ncbi:hypothetical protein ABK040_001574 [Willaertia magna]
MTEDITMRRRSGTNVQIDALRNTLVPSLYDMCAKLLQDNIDDIPVLENVDDNIVTRLLSCCSPPKLREIEEKNENEGVSLNTESLWEIFCKQQFGYKGSRNGRNWKAIYRELEKEREEREKKLQKLKKNQPSTSKTTSMTNVTKPTHHSKPIEIAPPKTRNRTSTSNDNSGISRVRKPSVSTTVKETSSSTSKAPGKSKLWAKSLNESSGPKPTMRRKEDSPVKQLVPGNKVRGTVPLQIDNSFEAYAGLPTARRFKQPIVQRERRIDFSRQRPSSPPDADAIQQSPVSKNISVASIFGEDTKTAKFDRLKRQTQQQTSMRQRGPPPISSNQRQPIPAKTSGMNMNRSAPPVSNSMSSPPLKKQKPNDNLMSSSSSLNGIHIPKKKR